ncbi:hypothetical protein BC830DRAFT_1162905 [Chytriomyces sp. MP71]|nr:hypothetical protein BC830DRAFT_1162905 [Chytriomyces sp. MP71]
MTKDDEVFYGGEVKSDFGVSRDSLVELVSPNKDVDALVNLGAVSGLVTALRSDETHGLSVGRQTPGTPGAITSDAPPTGQPADADARIEAFGVNRLPSVKPKSIFYFISRAFKDKIIILLSVVAAVSLGIGIYEDVTTKDPNDKVHWIEGFSVLVAVIIIVLVSSINDLQKDKQFRALNAKKEDRKVKGIRDGATQLISIYDILVGDILLLEPGDVIAADGVVITASGLKCDESSATGETDAIKKGGAHDPFILSGSKVSEGIGKYIVTGVGEHSFFGKIMMAMRTESEDTPLQIKLDGIAERIAKLGAAVAILVFVTLFVKYIIIVLKTNGFGNDYEAQESGAEVAAKLIKILLTSIAIVAVAVPEGLPLAVTLSLAYATTRMLKDNNLVRVLSACETMGNATTICSDKTGTLTQNRMTVVAGVIGKNSVFEGDEEMTHLPEKLRGVLAASESSASGRQQPGPSGPDLLRVLMEGVAHNSTAFESRDEATGTFELVGSKTEAALLEWSRKAGFDFMKMRGDARVTVIQTWPFSSERKSMATLIKVEREDGTSVYRLHVKGAPEIVMKYCDRVVLLPFSASPTAVARCARDRVVPSHGRASDAVPTEGSRSNPSGSLIYPLETKLQQDYSEIIEAFAVQSLRTICLAYKEFEVAELEALVNGPLKDVIVGAKKAELSQKKVRSSAISGMTSFSTLPVIVEPNASSNTLGVVAVDVDSSSFVDSFHSSDDEAPSASDILAHPVTFFELVKNLIVGSIVGIEDPLRPGVTEAVKACKEAGVFVRMVTGDNIVTAKSIAAKCGIYHSNGLVMEGQDFRKLSEEDMLATIPKLQVLARSSPLDKQILVAHLKQLGETVAVTGDGTNDGPALKMADIGFSMGIAGTEVAKEASSIILMDDSFSSVVKAILWGRSVNDSVKKFLQFQLSVNISAVLITFISALVDSQESSALTVVQLLWVNLIMDTFAALALATELPTNELLHRPPESKKAPLISLTMWKMIIGQAFLQLSINLVLLFAGPRLFNFQELINVGGVLGSVSPNDPPIALHQRAVLKTIIFNTFVMMQLFSLVNSRRIDSNVNVGKGIIRNPLFYCIFLGIAAAQALIVEFGDVAFQTTSLNGLQWLVCILAGSLTLPWGVIIRLIPNDLFGSTEKPSAQTGGFLSSEQVPDRREGTFSFVRRHRTVRTAGSATPFSTP